MKLSQKFHDVFFLRHSVKACGQEYRGLSKICGCNGAWWWWCSDRISSVKSRRPALEQECCCSSVSSVMVVMGLPVSHVNHMTLSCHEPAVSIQSDKYWLTYYIILTAMYTAAAAAAVGRCHFVNNYW